jgi:hypothetical protein
VTAKKAPNIDGLIKAEERRLNKIFANIDIGKKSVNQKLIGNAAFMAVTLQRLQDQVTREGAVITSINGNGFETINEHPAQKSYNTMINRYTMAIKHLTEIISKEPPKESKDELLEFLKE